MATGDFGPGRMPPDMFLNCNEEIKRQKEQTIRSQNVLVGGGRDGSRDRGASLGTEPWRGRFWRLILLVAKRLLGRR